MKLLSILPRIAIGAALIVSIMSCSENLDSSGTCDVLCPSIGGSVQTTTIDAVVIDTTVQSLSGLGTEPGLLLANRGDTLDTRVVIRFDSLPQKFVPNIFYAKPSDYRAATQQVYRGGATASAVLLPVVP